MFTAPVPLGQLQNLYVTLMGHCPAFNAWHIGISLCLVDRRRSKLVSGLCTRMDVSKPQYYVPKPNGTDPDYIPGICLLMTLFCPDVTPDLMLSRRFALEVFFIWRWFIPVAPCRIFPVPVTSNRFAAVFLVLILGTLN